MGRPIHGEALLFLYGKHRLLMVLKGRIAFFYCLSSRGTSHETSACPRKAHVIHHTAHDFLLELLLPVGLLTGCIIFPTTSNAISHRTSDGTSRGMHRIFREGTPKGRPTGRFIRSHAPSHWMSHIRISRGICMNPCEIPHCISNGTNLILSSHGAQCDGHLM